MNLRGLVAWLFVAMGGCALALAVVLALAGSVAAIPVVVGGAVAGLIGLVDLLNRRFDHRPVRDQFVDPRIARSLLGILALTVLTSAQLVFVQDRSAWFLLLPMLPFGAWLVVRTVRDHRRPS